MSDFSLEDMLSDKDLPADEPAVDEPSEPTTEPAVDEPTGDGEPAKPADDEPAAKADEPKDDPTPGSDTPSDPEESWTKKAVLDERRKRQELQAQLDQLKSQQAEQPTEKPDWYDDPEKAAQHQAQQLKGEVFAVKVELSQDMMRSQHEDYDEMEAKFFDMAQENPQLRSQIQQAANPARFAYETAKKAEKLEALQNVDEFEAKLTAKVRGDLEAKIRAELEAEYKKKAEKEGAVMPSLSSANSRGGLSSSDYSGPTELKDILK